MLRPVPAAPRRLQPPDVPRPDLAPVGARQLLDRPSARTIRVRPTAPGPPPASPGGGTTRCPARIATVIGARNRIRRTTPSPPRNRPAPPDPSPQPELVQHHRKAPFQHLRIGQPRVRHVRMHPARPRIPRPVRQHPGPGPAADRLVVLQPRRSPRWCCSSSTAPPPAPRAPGTAPRSPPGWSRRSPRSPPPDSAGDSIVPAGSTTSSGFITPSFIGMSSSTRQRNT